MNALYLLGSVLGIGLLVGLNLLLMGRARARLDLEAAKALLANEYPGFRAVDAVATVTADAALIADASGVPYLVTAFGDKMVSRRLSGNGIASLARKGNVLALQFRDPTFPRARLALRDDTEAENWQRRLERATG